MTNNLQLKITILFLFFALSGIAQEKTVNYEALDNYIATSVKNYDLTGLSIALIKDNEVVFTKAYGSKNTKFNQQLETASLFNIASCSKAFTASCLSKLVNEGKLKWSDKVTSYLPDFKLADPNITSLLTVEDLLCHRSGLGTFYGDLLWYQTDYSQEEIMKRMEFLPITVQYRSEFGYQNDMYIVAGKIIEKITGLTWGEYLKENILTPLNMLQTRVASKYLDKNQNIAMPHLKKEVEELYLIDEHPALSIYSSTDELSNWVKMLLNKGQFEGKTILDEKVVRDLFTARLAMPVSSYSESLGTNFKNYAIGWSTFDYAGKKIVEHDGGMPGYISKVCLVPSENLGMIILTNDMNYLPTALRYRILDLFFSESEKDWAQIYLGYQKASDDYDQEKKEKKYANRNENTKPTLKLKEYAGSYEDKMYGKAEITFEKGELTFTMLPAKKAFTSKMAHWQDNSFHIKLNDNFLPEGWVNFYFDENKNLEGFKIELENPDFHFFNLDFVKK